MDLDTLDQLIGGVPVSEQLDAALECMATKDHVHTQYITRDEFEELQTKIDMLIDLVGDVPISAQIDAAIKNIAKG